MKKCVGLFFLLIILTSCSPSSEELAAQTKTAQTSIAAEWTRTPTVTATATSTLTPTLIPTPTITPTIKLPALENTPIPYTDEIITVDNILEVKTLAKWGKGFIDGSFNFPEWDCFIVTSGDSVFLYNSDTFEEIASTQFTFTGWIIDIKMPESGKIIFLIWLSQSGVITSLNRNARIVQWSIETNQIETLYDYSNLPCYINDSTRLSDDGEKLLCVNETDEFFLIPVDNPDDYTNLGNPDQGSLYNPSFDFSPDGTKIILFWYPSEYGTYYSHILVWDILNSSILGSASIKANGYAINPDGKSFALIDENQGEIQFYSIDTLEQLGKIRTGIETREMTYSNNGDRFVISSEDNEISVWDISNGNSVVEFNDLKDQNDYLSDVFFLEGDENIIFLTRHHKIIKWHIKSKTIITQTTSETHIYSNPILMENEHTIAFGDETGRIQVWDLSSNQLVWEITHDKPILWLVYDQNNQRIIFGDGYSEYAIELVNQEVAPLSTNSVEEVSISPDHTLIAGYQSGNILLLDINQLDVICEITSRNNQQMIFSPDGRLFINSEAYSAAVWDISKCQNIASISFGQLIENISFSEDGEYLMVTYNDFFDRSQPITFKMWETENWTLVDEKLIQQENPVYYSGNFVGCGDYILLPDGLYQVGDWETPLFDYDSMYGCLPCNENFIFRSAAGCIELLGLR